MLPTLRQHSDLFAWGIIGLLFLFTCLTKLCELAHSLRARRISRKPKCPPNWPPITRACLLLLVLPLVGCHLEDCGDPHGPQSLYQWPLEVAQLCCQLPNWFLWFAVLTQALVFAAMCIAAMTFAYHHGWRSGKKWVISHYVLRTAEFDVQDHAPARFEDHASIKPTSCAADNRG